MENLIKILSRSGARGKKLLSEIGESAAYSGQGIAGAAKDFSPSGAYHSAKGLVEDTGHSLGKFGRGMQREGQFAYGAAKRHVGENKGAYGLGAGAAIGAGGAVGIDQILEAMDNKKRRRD